MIDDLQKMTKRRFVKTATALGISTASLRFGTQEGLANAVDDPENEVPYVAKMKVKRDDEMRPIGRIPIYKTVPRDIWVDSKTATKATRQIQDQIREAFPRARNSTAWKVRMPESSTGFGVKVLLEKEERPSGSIVTQGPTQATLRNELPSKVQTTVGRENWESTRSNIPVIVDESIKLNTISTAESNNNPAYDNIHNWEYHPGGCVVNGATANASFQMNGAGYEPRLTTCGHVARDEGGNWGNPEKSNSDGTIVKSVDQWDGLRYQDYALLREPDNKIKEGIRTVDGTDRTWIGGTIMNEDLDYGGDWSRQRYSFQGKMTGRTGENAVEIWGYHPNSDDEYSNNATLAHSFVRANEPINGDSGGIYFWLDDDNQAWIMGIHRDVNGSNKGVGNTAEAMEKALGGYFS